MTGGRRDSVGERFWGWRFLVRQARVSSGHEEHRLVVDQWDFDLPRRVNVDARDDPRRRLRLARKRREERESYRWPAQEKKKGVGETGLGIPWMR